MEHAVEWEVDQQREAPTHWILESHFLEGCGTSWLSSHIFIPDHTVLKIVNEQDLPKVPNSSLLPGLIEAQDLVVFASALLTTLF
jgi:hypothetical protein